MNIQNLYNWIFNLALRDISAKHVTIHLNILNVAATAEKGRFIFHAKFLSRRTKNPQNLIKLFKWNFSSDRSKTVWGGHMNCGRLGGVGFTSEKKSSGKMANREWTFLMNV